MPQLIAGANTALPNVPLRLEIRQHGQKTADISAYVLAESTQKVRGDQDMIFYNQPSNANRSIVLTSQQSQANFDLSLNQLEPSIGKVAICATLDAPARFNSLNHIELALTSQGQIVATAQIDTKLMNEAALILGEFYRRNNEWKFRLIAQGFNGGLQPLAEHFGVDIADTPPPAAPQPTAPNPFAAPPTPGIPVAAPAPGAPTPPRSSISLSKISLDKTNSRISLEKQGASFSEIKINLNWNTGNAPAGAPTKGGFFSNLLGSNKGTNNGIDLDLGCLFELKNGRKGVIQALGKQFGQFNEAPYIHLLGDDRTGSSTDGEWMRINGAHWDDIKRLIVFAFIYEGVPNWAATDGVVRVLIPNQPEIEVRMDEGSSLGLCGIVEISNIGGKLQVERIVRYFRDQEELDRAFKVGLNWRAGSK